MLLERAEILMREGQEAAFAATAAGATRALLAAVPGVRSVSIGRGVENPGKFMLLVEWQDMEAHAAFSKSPANEQLRALLRPFSKGGSMEHFEMG